CIVTRYYGGIKLGASNLLRTYSNSVIETLNKTNKLELINGYNAIITFEYNTSKLIDNILKDSTINNKEFKENIIYNINIEENILNILKELNIDIKIIKRVIIKK
ncbi:MAG TPA: YigZ family protein, partial [Bacilli bacterium]|nr:YigZ family protein [Bacilli bacterium]